MHTHSARPCNVNSRLHTVNSAQCIERANSIACVYACKEQQQKQQRFRSRPLSLNCCNFFAFLLTLLLFECVSYAHSNDINEYAKMANTTTNFESNESQKQSTKPNIVIILIDDMGFNDLSFHGSNQILTPNIDALAYNGIILNRHYVPNLCTPSRATLLTGKYPIHTGTQHFVIVNDEPWGLPLTERLMPEIFRDAGYSTNLIGKWHLGFWKKEMTPTMRGFDYHYGYYSGYIDYYDYTSRHLTANFPPGFDLRRNLMPWTKANGTYATVEFTREAVRVIEAHDEGKPLFLMLSHLAVHTGNNDDPMQAPEEEVNKFEHIKDKQRRIYAGMISSLDQSVGRTIRALADKGILNNTIVLLYSDNGAPTVGLFANGGSNYPLRGQKESPWEGGLRSAGLIWSPHLQQQSYVSNQLIHACDWLPTLASAANISLPTELKLDGMNQWTTLSQNLPPQSRSLLHVLDDNFGYASYMRGSLKYINGTTNNGIYDGWLGERAGTLNETDPLAAYYVQSVLSSEVHRTIGQNTVLTIERVEALRAQATLRCPEQSKLMDSNAEMYKCNPLKAPCLFNIDKDPCERYNLASEFPEVLADLQHDVDVLRSTAVPSARVAYSDPYSNPALHNGTWEWWFDLEKNSNLASSLQQTNLVTGIWVSICTGLSWLWC